MIESNRIRLLINEYLFKKIILKIVINALLNTLEVVVESFYD